MVGPLAKGPFEGIYTFLIYLILYCSSYHFWKEVSSLDCDSNVYFFFAGFQLNAGKFGVFYLTLALTSMSGAALAFTCSAMVSVFAVANLLVSLVFILYMVRPGI